MAALLLSPAAARAAEKVQLEMKYPPGHYEMVQQQKVTIKVAAPGRNGPPVKKDTTLTLRMHTSQPDAEGRQTMQLVFKRIQQETEAGAMGLSYDSADPKTQSGPLAKALKPIVGAKIDAVFRNGEVEAVKGMDKLWDKIGRSTRGAAAVMAGRMKTRLGNATVKGMIGAAGRFLPEKPVSEGTKWKNSRTVPVPVLGKTKMASESHLVSLKPRGDETVARIQFAGDMTADESQNTLAGQQDGALDSLKGHYAGHMDFLVEKGMMLNQAIEMDLKMAISGSARGRKVPQRLQVNSRTETAVRELTAEELKEEAEEEAEE